MRRVLVAVVLIGLLSGCGPSGGSSSHPSPSESVAPPASPTPPAGFVATAVTGGAVSDSAVMAVRVGQQSGYDQFVIEFGGGVPSYSVTPQASSTFTRTPKGDRVTLEGTTGVLVVVHSVTNWTSYSGPTTFQPGYAYLRQAVQVENYEGYQQWGLGVHGIACVRVTLLSSPNRLVVDVVGI